MFLFLHLRKSCSETFTFLVLSVLTCLKFYAKYFEDLYLKLEQQIIEYSHMLGSRRGWISFRYKHKFFYEYQERIKERELIIDWVLFKKMMLEFSTDSIGYFCESKKVYLQKISSQRVVV